MPGGARGNAAVPMTLPVLQNLIKRDPQAYEEEFTRWLAHFQSVLALQRETPSADAKEMIANVSFVAHCAACFPKLVTGLPQQLADLLEAQHDALDQRAAAGSAAGAHPAAQPRGLMPALDLLKLCFRLFRAKDKSLRSKLTQHVVADLKMVNLKKRDVQLPARCRITL